MKLSVPYLVWRAQPDGTGRPRWEPGPKLRKAGFKGADLKDERSAWLGREAAIAAAERINAEAAAYLAGGTAIRRPPPARRRGVTCQDVFDRWRATPEYRLLGERTRADYACKAAAWLADFGDEPVAAVSRKTLKGFWREAYEERGHHMANGILAVVRAMLTFAVDEEWIASNPAFALKLKTPPPRVAFWSPAKVAAFVATADAMGHFSIADAVVIGLHSGQRQGDVLAMPPTIFDDGRIKLTQFKRGALIDVPFTPQLAQRLAGIRARRAAGDVVALARATVVTDERTGAAWDENAFRKAFRAVRAEAACRHPELLAEARFQPGLADLRYQDLRDTTVTRLADADCNLAEIRSVTGHTPASITRTIEHYLATTDAQANNAIAKYTAWLDRNRIAL